MISKLITIYIFCIIFSICICGCLFLYINIKRFYTKKTDYYNPIYKNTIKLPKHIEQQYKYNESIDTIKDHDQQSHNNNYKDEEIINNNEQEQHLLQIENNDKVFISIQGDDHYNNDVYNKNNKYDENDLIENSWNIY
jgi:hypothetical protein